MWRAAPYTSELAYPAVSPCSTRQPCANHDKLQAAQPGCCAPASVQMWDPCARPLPALSQLPRIAPGPHMPPPVAVHHSCLR